MRACACPTVLKWFCNPYIPASVPATDMCVHLERGFHTAKQELSGVAYAALGIVKIPFPVRPSHMLQVCLAPRLGLFHAIQTHHIKCLPRYLSTHQASSAIQSSVSSG